MAIQWAAQKCNYYLRGLPSFEVWTDHRPLIGLFKLPLHQVDNPRLSRMREKLSVYSFTPVWVEGKDHKISDALSRFPVFSPDISLDTEIHEVMRCQRTFNASGMSAIHQAVDKDYECMIEACLLYTSPSPRD